jgi:hypothetical protein
MEHTQAIETMAAERYVLDEMSAEERDAFEIHFLNCAICDDEVRSALVLMESGRASASNVVPFPKPRRTTWLAGWIAAGVMTAIVGFQNLVTIPRMAATAATATVRTDTASPIQALTAYPPSDVSRGGESETPRELPRAGTQFIPDIDIPTDPPYPQYRADLRDATGRSLGALFIPAAQVQETQLVLGSLPAGTYQLVIDGVSADGNRKPVTSHTITVQGP